MLAKYTFLFFLFVSFFNVAQEVDEEQKINVVLDAFHQAAADSKANEYFSLMTDEAVFLGTDASERWTKAEFKRYAEPHFNQGNGWTYKPKQRNVSFINNKQVAFFDELLVNKQYGLCRGTGVVVNTKQGWKISQYNLSVPLPNDIAKNLVEQIKQFKSDN